MLFIVDITDDDETSGDNGNDNESSFGELLKENTNLGLRSDSYTPYRPRQNGEETRVQRRVRPVPRKETLVK